MRTRIIIIIVVVVKQGRTWSLGIEHCLVRSFYAQSCPILRLGPLGSDSLHESFTRGGEIDRRRSKRVINEREAVEIVARPTAARLRPWSWRWFEPRTAIGIRPWLWGVPLSSPTREARSPFPDPTTFGGWPPSPAARRMSRPRDPTAKIPGRISPRS